jgi:RNA polymerase sigma-70 factor (ECF subfamily)
VFLKLFRRKTDLTDADYLTDYKRTGDLVALGELYERYMDMVYGLCYKYLQQEAEAKDAVMQIFEKLITDLRIHEVSNFKSWLHSVARNHCLMQLRSQKVMVGDESIFETEKYENWAVSEPTDVFEIDQQLSALSDCLQTLTSEQRQSIDLFYWQQKCYQDIVELTGFELNKVKSYLQNGKRNLKNCIEQRHE